MSQKMTRDYGAFGGERDTDGTVMHAKKDLAHDCFSNGARVRRPLSTHEIKMHIKAYHQATGKKPEYLFTTETKDALKHVALSVSGVGVVSLTIRYEQEQNGVG